MWTKRVRPPLIWASVAVVGIIAAFGLFWFQPWKLFTDTRVDEALPVAERAPTPTGSASIDAASRPAATKPVANRIVSAGDFITHEHETTGSAEIVRLADGRHQLVLRDLDTSNGPDLRVWLTDQPVKSGPAGWRVFDDGKWIELARLKGNRGDQVYELPAAVDPADFRSVSIWCKRFSVSFGAADLRTA
ncbi:DM13 domain-containing protein [Micromonospora sp. WP24]|uniref:DM13 domain-containing protein n=1 Tax=Micromonospora sp. WP24 TaxID=2604469 RepID=UPI0011D4C5E1|nr:DM13 domain-containing protein [Micromonospora sp. WP24]TYB96991.1 DM13 domain-containing protein [Micromonospora sp. WP24]